MTRSLNDVYDLVASYRPDKAEQLLDAILVDSEVRINDIRIVEVPSAVVSRNANDYLLVYPSMTERRMISILNDTPYAIGSTKIYTLGIYYNYSVRTIYVIGGDKLSTTTVKKPSPPIPPI